MAEPPVIKEEASASPAPLDEEDLLEDAGDLEFYDKSVPSTETLYLCRLPRSTWKAWMELTKNLGDDDEVQIGTIRTWNEQSATTGQTQTKLRMLLDSKFAEHQLVPKEYEMEVTDHGVKNHYVFGEEHLPGYKEKNKARQAAADAGIPMHLLRNQNQNQNQDRAPRRPFDRNRRWQPFYRKAIPKKTKVIGKVLHDVRVEPSDPREEERLLQQQMREAEQSKTKLKIISRNDASSSINPGTTGASNWGGNFIKTNIPPKPKKGEVFKATRVEREVLLDWLFSGFREYQYWSMKALKQKTKQPEAWLRQNLDDIAVLVKSGPFANHYTLADFISQKQEYSGAKEAAAEINEEEDEDEDEEMEDVVPTA